MMSEQYWYTNEPEEFPDEWDGAENEVFLPGFECSKCGYKGIILRQWCKQYDAEVMCPGCENKVIIR